MRLVFLGTPESAVAPLRALVAEGHEVVLVVSQPDRRRGRGARLVPTAVKAAAVELGLAVSDKVDDVLGVKADLGVVVAFGRLIRPHVLAAIPMVNLHFSLLPRWRGAAPVERAILAGDTETGVCVMEVEEGLDTGGVYGCEAVSIGPEETAEELRDRLVEIGTGLLVETLRRPLGRPQAQVGEPTYAKKIDPEELRLDWARPAIELHRVIRLGEAWTMFRRARLGVHRARLGPASFPLSPGELARQGQMVLVGTGEGNLELVELQPEGRARQLASAWWNGARVMPGERLAEGSR